MRRTLLAALSIVSTLAPPAVLAEDPRPVGPAGPAAIEEKVEVRLVQVAVSVTDPKVDSYRSVAGFTLDHFDLRLDGRPLTAEQRAKVLFDPVCEAETPAAEPAVRPVIAIVDFNYVLAAGREKVARSLEEIAERAGTGGLIVKVYGVTRQVRQLTSGFTRDAEEIRAAAREIRRTAFVREVPSGGVDGSVSEGIPSSEREASRGREEAEAAAQGQSVDPGGGAIRPMDVFQGTTAFTEEARWSAEWNNFEHDYDPGASLGAIEGILRAHSYLAGRKAAVIFTSEAFRYPDVTKLEDATAGIEEVARLGFTLWTVDTAGIGRERTGASELITMLGGNTGGGSLRRTNDLGQAFRRAEEQLSCYYLISLPVAADPARTVRRPFIVNLDTAKFPKLWGLRVSAPTQIVVPDRASVQRARRIAALLSPEDFDRPPVTATLAYPASLKDRSVLTTRFRVPLAGLSWTGSATGGVESRVLVDAVVERDTGSGRETVCEAGTEKTGVLTLRMPAAPQSGALPALAIELPCAWRKDGLYTARGVVTDLEAETSGAGRSTAMIRRMGTPGWRAFDPRVEIATGLDLLWRPGLASAQRDRERRASRAVAPGSTASASDRIVLRYVLCGPDPAQARERVRHALALQRDGAERVLQTFGTTALSLPEGDAPGAPFCAPASITVPEFTLEPGTYAFVVSSGEQELGRAGFEVK